MEVSIFLADGVEECEALLVVDLFRRGEIEIQTVAVRNEAPSDRVITSSHAVQVSCDIAIADYDSGDEKLLVIPGGKAGVENLKANEKLSTILRSHADAGRGLGAVCAGPTVLGVLGLLDGKTATVFPGFDDGLGSAEYTDVPVAADKQVVTGRALGSTIPFALEMITRLRDRKTAQNVADQICFDWAGPVDLSSVW